MMLIDYDVEINKKNDEFHYSYDSKNFELPRIVVHDE
jgi:hypothetical protein